MKIVVTGGAGFIGSHIVDYWYNSGADVVVIDNLRSGFEKNIESFEGITFIKESITNEAAVNEALRNADYVFNLAALVSVPESLEKPYECLDINVKGLLNILEAARKHKIKKVVHSSSAAVYGDDPELPKKRDMKPNPKTPYSITKLDGEYYCKMYSENFGLDAVSLRYFNVYGERQDPKSQYAAAIPIITYKALKNQDVIIYGDGMQTRDFVYVKDVVKANVLAAQSIGTTGVFNVACGKSVTILDLAKSIIELTGSSSKILFEKERPGDIKHSLASIDETENALGFYPESDLREGLLKTINFFKG